jgi:hypothetical protein
MNFRSNKRYILFLLLLLVCQIQAQSPDYFIYPQSLNVAQYNSSIGLYLADLPEDQVEEASALLRGPLFNYKALFGLPANFQLYGSFHTNFITFHFALGPKWRYEYEKFALAVGYDIAYWFGKLEQFGFNSKVRGWISYPNLTVGYNFDKFSISVKGELIFYNDIDTWQDEVKLSTNVDTYSGFAIGVYIEQPLWKKNYVILGLKVNYTKYYYPTWAAFTTFNRRFYIPEFVLGFTL